MKTIRVDGRKAELVEPERSAKETLEAIRWSAYRKKLDRTTNPTIVRKAGR